MRGFRRKVSFSELVDWVEGRLTEDQARSVEERVAVADSATLAEVAWLRKFARAAEEAVLESPPPAVRSTLVSRFEAHAESRRTPGFLKRVVATLQFDGVLRPAVGVRAADAQGVRRQLIYSADAFDVALNFRPRVRDKNLVLDGQVFARDDAELGVFGVQLLQDGTEVAITTTDELGAFAFESVPPGVYEVILSSDRIEVSIGPVELNA